MPDQTPSQDRAHPPIYGPFAKLIGYQLSEWSEGRAVVVLTAEERHMNRSGILHGGVLSILIDTACSLAGCYRAPPAPSRRALSLSLHTQFLGRIQAGAHLSAEARVTGGGQQIFFSSCEVRDGEGHLVGRGDGTFRYRREA